MDILHTGCKTLKEKKDSMLQFPPQGFPALALPLLTEVLLLGSFCAPSLLRLHARTNPTLNATSGKHEWS